MIKLNAGNVLLKPSNRRQLMTWMKRVLRLGERLGNFVLTINMQRFGKMFEVRASVNDSLGSFVCRSRRHDWRDAARDLVRMLALQLRHQQWQRMGIA